LVRLPGITAGPPTWREGILLLNHNREIEKAGSVIALPARAILTKNKHLLAIYSIPARGFTAAVSVFVGTPPPKPLNCKSVANRLGARLCSRWAEPAGGKPRLSWRLNSFCAIGHHQDVAIFFVIIVHPASRDSPFVAAIHRQFQGNKNPAYVAVSRVREIFRRSSEPAYAKSIQITFGPLPDWCRG